MFDTASLMVHSASRAVYGTAAELKQALKDVRAINRRMAQIISDRTGKPLVAVKRWLNGPDHWFTATQCLDLGFCDSVIPTPQPKVAAQVPTNQALRDDGKSKLLFEVLDALGPIETADRNRVLRDLHYWAVHNVKQTELPQAASVHSSIVEKVRPRDILTETEDQNRG